MDLHFLIDNLTNPALLFFALGILAVQLNSDLEIPPSSSKFISLYLIFSIGFKGGQELSHSSFSAEIYWSLFALVFAIVIPMVNGCVIAISSGLFMESIGDHFLLSILAASASYIAVPAAMRIAAPEANPSLYLPMALAITFPFNITLGMPLYMTVLECFSVVAIP